MKLKTLLIDDEPMALEKLSGYAKKVPFLEVVAECSNTFDASKYLADNDVDLIFTDINMPDQNGIEFIETLSNSPMVVFTTAYSEYAVESYKVNTVDYLLKPYRFVDFQRAANKALETYELHNNRHQGARDTDDPTIYIKYSHRFHRVDMNNIMYVKGYGEYLQVYLKGSERPITTLSSFPAILRMLNTKFRQVHRSFIVNTDYIKSVERSKVTLIGNIDVPMSEAYREDIRAYVAQYAVLRK